MRAIILAAGLGSRLRPMTLHTPKPLLLVYGKSILEHNIELLLDNGFDDIVVVCGYKHESFDELQKKLCFTKIVFEDYEGKNSAASLKFAKDFIQKGTLVLNGDLYLTKSPLNHARFGVTQILAQVIKDKCWGYATSSDCVLLDIDIDCANSLGDGVAFFDNESDMPYILESLAKCSDDEYWEALFLELFRYTRVYVFDNGEFYVEIDSFKDALQQNMLTPQEVAQACSDNGEATRLAGITNINYKIRFLGKDKVIRIANKDIDRIINRKKERQIFEIIEKYNITPKCEFYESGIRLSDFLQSYHHLKCNELNDNVLEKIISQMHILHKIKHEDYSYIPKLSLVNEIKKYEQEAKVILISKIEKRFLLNIAKELDTAPSVLCHRDLQLPNILYDGDNVCFIDFEYAEFTSIALELGNFTSELLMCESEINKVCQMYGDIKYDSVIKGQAIANYIWALWGFIYDDYPLARDYLVRFHANLKYLMENNA
ncbi:sugar phosphate nucleotidyltransferase [Helicobacter ibis]|uniref:Sugar phosphate nucleotidyltransferase n=1 Tax=Helicobacter ibis TaxID=2962633 RepID=A0ABT4VFE8_9HELI|nr:sugar phosphate nucleotidyltransferase [Helicobacter ibis]MDA3969412.1 sugar phosphate nucleotidyltransferase [Helicobacter ibis]